MSTSRSNSNLILEWTKLIVLVALTAYTFNKSMSILQSFAGPENGAEISQGYDESLIIKNTANECHFKK